MSTDKIVLITGSTDGVGHRVATRLAASGAHILVHGRNAERGLRLVDDIRRTGGQARFYAADLSELENVRSLAIAITHDYKRLDVLINNAGIGVGLRGSKRQLSPDGYELRFAVNYLSGFLLTRMLLPLLQTASPSRIINVTSVGQQAIDFDNVMLAHNYSGAHAYCQSKLAQIMFTFDLAHELDADGITVNCLHPATYMDTTMVRNDGIAPMTTVEQGADAIVHLATARELNGRSGLYLEGTRVSKAHSSAYDSRVRAQLRQISLKLARIETHA